MLKEIYELWQSQLNSYYKGIGFSSVAIYTTKKSYPTARPIATVQAYGLKTSNILLLPMPLVAKNVMATVGLRCFYMWQKILYKKLKKTNLPME